MEISNIIEVNLYNQRLKDKFLLIGTCVKDLYPQILKNFQRLYKNIFEYCLENGHYNILFTKLVDIISTGNISRIGFLTVDESPHCIQMHFTSRYLKRISRFKLKFEHYVISKNNKIYKIEIKDINNAKKLSRLGKLIKTKSIYLV
jgi:hypothetical protein